MAETHKEVGERLRFSFPEFSLWETFKSISILVKRVTKRQKQTNIIGVSL